MKEQSTNQYLCVAPDVQPGKDVKLANFINLYGCKIGNETKIGTFVEIQKKAKVGLRCTIYLKEGEELVEEPFQRLIGLQQPTAYRHEGFWARMDTLQDNQAFDDMNGRGDTPWPVWRPREGRARNA